MSDIEKLKSELICLIGRLHYTTLHEVKKFCEPGRIEAFVHGYSTAVDDMIDIINQRENPEC